MNIVMTGGTGFLGTALRQALAAEGHSITCLTRGKSGIEGSTTYVEMNALAGLPPHDAVINLAGQSILGLWTHRKRKAIYDSRIDTTRALADWIEKSSVKPSVFLSGSAAGIYGECGNREVSEKTDISRVGGFLAKVARDWEHAASSSSWRGTRTVLLRTSNVMNPSGGYLKSVLPIYHRFPIVILGPPGAHFPWIALEDWIGLALLALRDPSLAGPLNMVAPTSITQGEFTRLIATKLGKRVWGNIPAWLLKLGAGEFGATLSVSQKVLALRAQEVGYKFVFDSADAYIAAVDLR